MIEAVPAAAQNKPAPPRRPKFPGLLWMLRVRRALLKGQADCGLPAVRQGDRRDPELLAKGPASLPLPALLVSVLPISAH